MGHTTVGKIIAETTNTIWDALVENGYLNPPENVMISHKRFFSYYLIVINFCECYLPHFLVLFIFMNEILCDKLWVLTFENETF